MWQCSAKRHKKSRLSLFPSFLCHIWKCFWEVSNSLAFHCSVGTGVGVRREITVVITSSIANPPPMPLPLLVWSVPVSDNNVFKERRKFCFVCCICGAQHYWGVPSLVPLQQNYLQLQSEPEDDTHLGVWAQSRGLDASAYAVVITRLSSLRLPAFFQERTSSSPFTLYSH